MHRDRSVRLASILTVDIDFDVCLLERPPFEVFFVSTAFYVPPCTLLAFRLLFSAFQSFRFAGNASCVQSCLALTTTLNLTGSLKVLRLSDIHKIDIPLRLLDCLGFATAPSAFGFREAAFFAADDRLRTCSGADLGGLGGFGDARKKTEGEGIVMASAIWRRRLLDSGAIAQSRHQVQKLRN